MGLPLLIFVVTLLGLLDYCRAWATAATDNTSSSSSSSLARSTSPPPLSSRYYNDNDVTTARIRSILHQQREAVLLLSATRRVFPEQAKFHLSSVPSTVERTNSHANDSDDNNRIGYYQQGRRRRRKYFGGTRRKRAVAEEIRNNGEYPLTKETSFDILRRITTTTTTTTTIYGERVRSSVTNEEEGFVTVGGALSTSKVAIVVDEQEGYNEKRIGAIGEQGTTDAPEANEDNNKSDEDYREAFRDTGIRSSRKVAITRMVNNHNNSLKINYKVNNDRDLRQYNNNKNVSDGDSDDRGLVTLDEEGGTTATAISASDESGLKWWTTSKVAGPMTARSYSHGDGTTGVPGRSRTQPRLPAIGSTNVTSGTLERRRNEVRNNVNGTEVKVIGEKKDDTETATDTESLPPPTQDTSMEARESQNKFHVFFNSVRC